MVTFEGFKQMSSNIGLVWFFGFFSQTGFFLFFSFSYFRGWMLESGIAVALSERERW